MCRDYYRCVAHPTSLLHRVENLKSCILAFGLGFDQVEVIVLRFPVAKFDGKFYFFYTFAIFLGDVSLR